MSSGEVTIALADNGGFALTVPSTVNGSHVVLVPMTTSGLSIIRKVLSARIRETDRRIGHVSSPTQAQVEAWLAEERRQRAEEKAKAQSAQDTSVLSGLDLGDLDL